MEQNACNAYNAIKNLWKLTVKTRALCPVARDSAKGKTQYMSPKWYRDRGAKYVVTRAKPLKAKDIEELAQIGSLVNRSFVISMAMILEENCLKILCDDPCKLSRDEQHALLTKWLLGRNERHQSHER